jgi:hypothetical protein
MIHSRHHIIQKHNLYNQKSESFYHAKFVDDEQSLLIQNSNEPDNAGSIPDHTSLMYNRQTWTKVRQTKFDLESTGQYTFGFHFKFNQEFTSLYLNNNIIGKWEESLYEWYGWKFGVGGTNHWTGTNQGCIELSISSTWQKNAILKVASTDTGLYNSGNGLSIDEEHTLIFTYDGDGGTSGVGEINIYADGSATPMWTETFTAQAAGVNYLHNVADVELGATTKSFSGNNFADKAPNGFSLYRIDIRDGIADSQFIADWHQMCLDKERFYRYLPDSRFYTDFNSKDGITFNSQSNDTFEKLTNDQFIHHSQTGYQQQIGYFIGKNNRSLYVPSFNPTQSEFIYYIGVQLLDGQLQFGKANSGSWTNNKIFTISKTGISLDGEFSYTFPYSLTGNEFTMLTLHEKHLSASVTQYTIYYNGIQLNIYNTNRMNWNESTNDFEINFSAELISGTNGTAGTAGSSNFECNLWQFMVLTGSMSVKNMVELSRLGNITYPYSTFLDSAVPEIYISFNQLYNASGSGTNAEYKLKDETDNYTVMVISDDWTANYENNINYMIGDYYELRKNQENIILVDEDGFIEGTEDKIIFDIDYE